MKSKPEQSNPANSQKRIKQTLLFLGLTVVAWLVLAYQILPAYWQHYEYQQGLVGQSMLTHTKQGIAGDPINVGLIGSKRDVICAFNAAGWEPADPVTFRTSVKIIGSVVLNRPYKTAPVSPLLYNGKREDLAFQKQDGKSANHRHHIRLWNVLNNGAEGRPVWLGGATYDKSVGLSHYTLQVTHHIAAAIDDERDFISTDLSEAGVVTDIYQISGIGPTLMGRNGNGDRYFTDGEVVFSALAEDCQSQPGKQPTTKPAGAIIRLKDMFWKHLRLVL